LKTPFIIFAFYIVISKFESDFYDRGNRGQSPSCSFLLKEGRGHSISLIQAIDDILAGHYGLSTDELEYLKNYDIRFRLGE